jgi:serine/threonine protein phosphatase 1
MRKLPSVTRGDRIYAIGDIHGRLDLFETLIARIREDATVRPAKRTRLLLIGDMIDRGPSSAQLLRQLMKVDLRNERMIILRGNHEEIMLSAMGGDLEALEGWLRFGGDETLKSYGMAAEDLDLSLEEIHSKAVQLIGRDVLQWISDLPFSYRSGDFFFVHAGIRPGVPINAQDRDDMLWIREDFTEATDDHEVIVVHGHTIFEYGPEILRNRIGLDTGAYRTGRLSAVGFEGGRQWVITS